MQTCLPNGFANLWEEDERPATPLEQLERQIISRLQRFGRHLRLIPEKEFIVVKIS